MQSVGEVIPSCSLFVSLSSLISASIIIQGTIRERDILRHRQGITSNAVPATQRYIVSDWFTLERREFQVLIWTFLWAVLEVTEVPSITPDEPSTPMESELSHSDSTRARRTEAQKVGTRTEASDLFYSGVIGLRSSTFACSLILGKGPDHASSPCLAQFVKA